MNSPERDTRDFLGGLTVGTLLGLGAVQLVRVVIDALGSRRGA